LLIKAKKRRTNLFCGSSERVLYQFIFGFPLVCFNFHPPAYRLSAQKCFIQAHPGFPLEHREMREKASAIIVCKYFSDVLQKAIEKNVSQRFNIHSFLASTQSAA
jgi:hypothetical protein